MSMIRDPISRYFQRGTEPFSSEFNCAHLVQRFESDNSENFRDMEDWDIATLLQPVDLPRHGTGGKTR